MRVVVLAALIAAIAGGAVLAQGTIEDRLTRVEAGLAEVTDRVAGEDDDLRVMFKRGLRFESPDGLVKLKIGFRIHNDYIFPIDDDDSRGVVPFDENIRAIFRRARLYLSGTIYGNLAFKIQMDFTDGDADFKDVFMELKKVLGAFAVRVGQFKEPFGLEELTSSNYITFMERFAGNALAPSRSTGLMAHGTAAENLIAWAAGVFFDSDDYGDRDRPTGVGSEFNFTGRVAATPLYADKGNSVFHIGAAASHRNPNDDMVRYRARPEIRTINRIVDTGTGMAESVSLYNAEAAVVFGPFSAQGEYTHAAVNAQNGSFSDPEFRAFYLMASFFLTGETRPYDMKKKVFSRVQPNANLGEDGGCGAWEFAARYSNLNLNEQVVQGGELNSVTLGLNWYLNPNTRVMFNYVYANRDRMDPVQFAGVRFQIDF